MNILIQNGVLFTVLSDGTQVIADLTSDQVDYIRNNFSDTDKLEAWIRATFLAKQAEAEAKKEAITKGLSKLEKSGMFYYEGTSLYMEGINLSIPEMLAKHFAEAIENDKDRFNALVNFWKLCSINPNPEARQDLFKFLKGGNFTITPTGMFVAYRNVSIKTEGAGRKLAEFISASLIKVRGWKKSAKNFEVYQNTTEHDTHEGEYEIYDMKKRSTTPEGKHIGNLEKLSTTLEDETVYTDNHTQTFEIKIGEPVSMPREDCDHNAGRDCSYGLHLGNRSFLSRNSFGQVGLVCLCNPYNVTAVPHYNHNKLRCCEYLPIGIAEYDSSGKLIEVDTALYEDDYCQFTVDQINEMLAQANMEEHQINSLFEVTSNENIRELANEKIKDRNIIMFEDDEEWEDEEEEEWEDDYDDEDDIY